jgi:hypothetical protein
MIAAIRVATIVSIRVKPEAEALRALAVDPNLKAALQSETRVGF